MITLFDWLSQEALDLKYSIEAAGFPHQTIVLNDEGALPHGVTSPYAFFCQIEQGTPSPLYFNEVEIPDFWQITGTNTQGEVWNHSNKVANIFYHEPKYKRFVKTVDWLDRSGKVRYTAHYNKYGWVFAKTFFNAEQKPVIKKYLSKSGQEVISENLQTGSHLLTWNGQTYFFERKLSFFQFYLKVSGLDLSQIWYNTLSTPFLLSYYLEEEGQDILFWQESIGDEIPGNMKVILDGRAKRTSRIIFQDKISFDKAKEMTSPQEHKKMSYLGFIYPERRQNKNTKSIFILSNSDNIQHLDLLVEALPDYQFHIGALTEMSQKLMDYGFYENVTLYPNISITAVERLFENCDIYSDINHGNEILSAVRLAFENNLLVLAFENTVHQRSFVITDHIIQANSPEEMITLIQEQSDLLMAVRKQRSLSGQSRPEDYQKQLHLIKKDDI